MTYGKSKDLVKRTQSDKVLINKAFKIASDLKHDGYQRGLASMIYKFLIKNLLHLINLVEMISLMNQNINWQMNYINQLLENFKKEKFIHFLETIFRVLI